VLGVSMPSPDIDPTNQSGSGRPRRLLSNLEALARKHPDWPMLSFLIVIAIGIYDGLPPMGFVPRVLGLALGAFIGAVFIRFSARVLFKFVPPAKMAIYAMLVVGVANAVLNKLYGLAGDGVGDGFPLSAEGGFVVAHVLVAASVISVMIRTPEATPLGFRKASLLTIVAMAAGAIVFGLAYAVVRWLL
jgi:hypothetical protein